MGRAELSPAVVRTADQGWVIVGRALLWRRYAGVLCEPGGEWVGGGEALVEFGRQSDEGEGQLLPELRLEVSQVETLEYDECDKQGEDEVDYCCGVVFETVVERIVGGQDVEEVVLDVPPAVAGLPEFSSRENVFRYVCDPHPDYCLDFGYPFAANLFSFSRGLFDVEYPHGNVDICALEAFDVPCPDLGPCVFNVLFPAYVVSDSSEPLYILEKGFVVLFQYGDEALFVFDAQVYERGPVVQGVAADGVEEAREGRENTFEKALGASDLVFAGTYKLAVDGQGDFIPDNMADNNAMKILGDFFAFDGDCPCETLVAAPAS